MRYNLSMPTAYFIGGAPRVGKSLLAMQILQQHPMFALSADGVRDMLREILKPLDAPALFAIQNLAKNESAMAHFLRTQSKEGIEMQNDESAIMWPSINALILSSLADGRDILVEGVEILPSTLAHVRYPCKAVFLGNTSLEHANTIAEHAHDQPHDWMHQYANSTVEAWAGLTRSFSAFVKAEAKKHNMTYIETHDKNFQRSLAEAEQVLFS